MPLYILGLMASVLIGVSLGYVGGGGSIITVPVLIYLFGIPVHEAIGMSLVVVGITSATGAYLHYRNGTSLDLKSAFIFGVTGLAGAYFGSRLSALVPENVLLISFSVLMLVVSIAMFFRNGPHAAAAPPARWKGILVGYLIGFLTGFLGVGGGFLIVPALVLFARLEMRTAIGTSLLVISMNSVAGFAGHLHSASFDWMQILLVSGLSFSGLMTGILLARGKSPAQLRTAFALFVMVIGLTLFVLNV